MCRPNVAKSKIIKIRNIKTLNNGGIEAINEFIITLIPLTLLKNLSGFNNLIVRKDVTSLPMLSKLKNL